MTAMDGAGEFEGRAIDVTFGKAKAYAAAVLGFVGPGAGILINEVRPGGDGIQGNDLLFAGLFCLVTAAGGGGIVWKVTNKPKVTDLGPVR